MTDKHADALLSSRILQGDQRAVEELARLVYDRVMPVLYFETRGYALQDDLVSLYHDVILSVIRQIETYDPEQSQLITWSSLIGRNLARNFVKKERRRKASEGIHLYSYPERSDDSIDVKVEVDDLLEWAISKFDDERRQLLTWYFKDGESISEISRRLHESRDVVRRKIIEIRQLLRTQF